MLRFFLALCGAFTALCLPIAAQSVPAGYVRVYQGGLQDNNGVAVSNATVCAQAIAGGRPISVVVGGGIGSTVTRQVCQAVSSGAWSMALPDGSMSNPLNPGFQIVETDNTSGETIAQYSNVQPTSVTNDWCSAAGCSMDMLTPDVPQNTLTVRGQRGPMGPPGCAVGGSAPYGCGSSLSPQVLAGRGFPATESGVDLSAQVTAALARMGGTAAHPIERAVLELPVGVNFTTSTIVLPNDQVAPYVRKVDFICHDNTLTGSSTAQPILHVLPLNNNGGMNAGSISGCVFNDPGPGVPAVQVDARQAFEVYNNKFQGGDVALRETNTLFNDGGPGYHEQHWIHHNDFENMTTSGVEFLRNGGTDSFLYGSVDWTNHFQLLCGAAAIHIGAGITIQGGELSGRVNTTASTCADSNTYAVAIRNDASASGNGVYRGSVGHWSGEDTGGLGDAHLALFDGPGTTILFDHGTIVTGMSLKTPTASPYSHLSLPYNLYTDSFGSDYCANLNSENIGAGGLIARKPFLANCESSLRMYSGAEGIWGDMGQYYYSGTDPQHMGTVTSAWRSFPKALTFGPGYTPKFSDGTCPDPAGCNTPTATTEGRSLTIRIPGQTDGFTSHAEADGVHLTMEKSNTPVGQPTEWLTFDAYDTSGGTYTVKPMLKVRFENGAPNWYFPGLTGSGCAAMVIRADGSVGRGAAVTCP